MNRFYTFALTSLVLVSLSTVAHADLILYDNLPPNAPSSDSQPLSGAAPMADSFSTSAKSVLINDVKLLLAGDPSSTASFTVSLLADNASSGSSVPGSSVLTIGTMSDSVLSTTGSTIDFSFATPFTLAANTRYWIQLDGPTSSAKWFYAASLSNIGDVGEYWSYTSLGTPAVTPNDNFGNAPYQMKVSFITPPVPEPSSVALIVVGLAGLFVARRRLARV